MKLSKIYSLAPLALAACIRGSEIQFKIASELLTKVNDLDSMFNLLEELTILYETLDYVTQKDVILAIIKVTNKEFSQIVYDYYKISEEEIRYAMGIQARFGISNFLMAAFDPARILSGYGCWCRYGTGERGRSAPLDDIDHLCKNLQLSYVCLILDISKQEGNQCVPSEQPYDFDIGGYIMASMGMPGSTVADNCELNNPGSRCSAQTCELELMFLTDYIRGIMGDPSFQPLIVNDQFKHASIGGIFNDVEYCGAAISESQAVSLTRSFNLGTVTKDGNQDEEQSSGISGPVDRKACCGVFPKRIPYNTLSGEIGCCDDQIYSVVMDVCCDGVVSLSCY